MLNRSFEEASYSPACEHPQNVSCPNQHGHGQMDALNGKTLIQIVDGDRIIVFKGEDADNRQNDYEDQKPKVSHDILSDE